MKKKCAVILFFLWMCLMQSLYAQTAMGGWRTHFAYNSVTQIEQSENKVYAISNGALFSVDKLDGNVEIYSKLTGLNGSVISAIKYDAQNNQLIIAYDNGNIDLMTSGGIVNIPDFYNKVMTVNKSINHIDIHNNKAYLSCHFGIVVLNLQRREIAETYFIGPNASEVDVISTAVLDDEIYALAFTLVGDKKEYTLFKANVNDPNLVNYERWSTMPLPVTTTGEHQALASFAGNLFVQSDWSLYLYENGSWGRFAPIPVAVEAGISVSEGKLIVANKSAQIYSVDENLQVVSISNVVQYAHAGVYDAVRDTYWFAGGEVGAVSWQASTGAKNEIKPDGPYVNTAWDMTFAGEKLFVVPGGRWSGEYNRQGYVMIFDKRSWSAILPSDIFPNNPAGVKDLVNVAVDPFDDTHFYVTSYGGGLFEFKNNVFYQRYSASNMGDIFETAISSNPDGYTRLDGAVFDAQGNLFVANTRSIKGAIKVLTASDDSWHNCSYSGLDYAATLGKILIDKENPNRKWVLSARSDTRGIGVFDDNGTLGEQSDDKSKFMNSFVDMDNPGEQLIPESFYCIVQDHDGVVWVGTNMGPLLFNNTDNVFDDGYTCSRVKISRNDGTSQADYLLSEETIKAIAIDGANRKWIGTATSGVYLLSANGQETIQHFTTENSPLQSNDILSLAINPVSGEVFIGTGAGLVSYQSDAATGNETFENVYAYPNPVREHFDGVITITGLVENTQVKITDLNGNLICQTVSNGSIATWDGKDAFGRKVSTGIYLALCITEDGKDSVITKIMVIN